MHPSFPSIGAGGATRTASPHLPVVLHDSASPPRIHRAHQQGHLFNHVGGGADDDEEDMDDHFGEVVWGGNKSTLNTSADLGSPPASQVRRACCSILLVISAIRPAGFGFNLPLQLLCGFHPRIISTVVGRGDCARLAVCGARSFHNRRRCRRHCGHTQIGDRATFDVGDNFRSARPELGAGRGTLSHYRQHVRLSLVTIAITAA